MRSSDRAVRGKVQVKWERASSSWHTSSTLISILRVSGEGVIIEMPNYQLWLSPKKNCDGDSAILYTQHLSEWLESRISYCAVWHVILLSKNNMKVVVVNRFNMWRKGANEHYRWNIDSWAYSSVRGVCNLKLASAGPYLLAVIQKWEASSLHKWRKLKAPWYCIMDLRIGSLRSCGSVATEARKSLCNLRTLKSGRRDFKTVTLWLTSDTTTLVRQLTLLSLYLTRSSLQIQSIKFDRRKLSKCSILQKKLLSH